MHNCHHNFDAIACVISLWYFLTMSSLCGQLFNNVICIDRMDRHPLLQGFSPWLCLYGSQLKSCGIQMISIDKPFIFQVHESVLLLNRKPFVSLFGPLENVWEFLVQECTNPGKIRLQ